MQVKNIMKEVQPGKSGKTGGAVSSGAFVNAEESIDNAAILMKKNKLSCLPVVDDNKKVIGVITRDDLIEASDELNEDFFLE